MSRTLVPWLAVALSSALAACGDGGLGAPETWDLSRLPKTAPAVREAATPSGARVLVLEEGRGEPPGAGQPIDVRYKGYLLTGESFDEGTLPGVEVGATPRRLITGFDEGLAGIRVGEKRRLLVPAHLGYGPTAKPGIPAHSGLVFDVERLPDIAVEVLDVREGTGAEARFGREITVHYRGTLRDGKVFDSSYDRGKPATFRLAAGELIGGWLRGIPGMKAGGVRVLRVPPELGYGKRGSPPKIPPDAELTFEIELLDVR